jgi:hypothetical protein
MITFKKDITLTIVDDFDEETDNITSETTETFKAGEPVDANIVSDPDSYGFVDLQFGDGSVAMGVQRSSFVLYDDVDEMPIVS